MKRSNGLASCLEFRSGSLAREHSKAGELDSLQGSQRVTSRKLTKCGRIVLIYA